ncbi:MAG: ParB/RepB/Spo0J family partition protein [bacterium]
MSTKPNRLGKGLDSLIPTSIEEFASEEVSEALQLDERRILDISVDQVDPNPFQPRKEFNDEDLADLAASIKQYGIVQPLIVTKANSRYQLIAGERRLRAAQLVGQKTVPVIVRSFDEQQQLEVAVIENIQRAELTVLELAVAYQQLSDQFNLTAEDISKRVGKAIPTVRNIIRLLKLPYEAKKALQEGKIVEGHARMILSIDDEKQQQEMLEMIIAKGLTVRQAEDLARNYKADKELVSSRAKKVEHSYKSVTDGLAKHLGTKVQISSNSQGGKVVLRFFSEEELKRLYEHITGESLL